MPEKFARTQEQLVAENADLLNRLDEAKETLRAIRSSEVDALFVPGVDGEQLFTLKGADHPYRVLVEAMSEGALTLSQDGLILYANRRMAEMLKMPLEKVIGSSLKTWIAPEGKQILLTLLGNDAEKERRLQLDLSTRDGSRVPVSLSVSNQQIDERPVSFCLVVTDLTEQKRSDEIKFSEKLARELLAAANQSRRVLLSVVEDQKITEDALSASESELRTLFASMQDTVLVIDREGVYLKIVPTDYESHILPPHDLLGKNLKDLFPAQQAEFFHMVIQQVLNSKQSMQIEYELNLDHQSEWYQTTVSPKSDDSTLWVARDITQRKHAEESLLLQSTALNAAANAIMITSINGTIEWINPAYSTLTGYSSEEVVGKNPRELVRSGKHAQDFYKEMWDTILAGEVYFGTLINRRKDGSLYTEEQTITPLTNSDGKISHFIAIKQDITEREQRDEEIKTRNEELSALYTLSRLLADAQDLEHVIKLVNLHTAESIHNTLVAIALLENDTLVTRGIHEVRVLEIGTFVENRQPITALPNCKRVLDQNEPAIFQTELFEPNSPEYAFLRLHVLKSVCLVPLRVGNPLLGTNQPLGLLILGEARGEERAPFTSEKVNLARSIGDQAASAIRRMLVIEQANHRLQRIASLREIDGVIAQSLDLRISLEVILRHLSEQLGVDAADVLVVNTSLQNLEFKAGRGFRTPAKIRIQQRLGEGQAGMAIVERRMVQIPDVAASGAVFVQPELLKNEQISVYFAVPLIIKGQVNGVLEIFHRTPLKPDDEWFDFLNTLAGQTAIAIDNDRLFNGLQHSNLELGMAYDATIEGWSYALDLRDKETEGHTQRVTEMTIKLAQSFNITNGALKQVRWGALLHDIGKMGVPDGILFKPGPLTDDEWVVMKKHPILAFEMLMPIHYLKDALDIPYCHHEKWDGSGYPRGLKGEQIPLAARIFAVVDVWDALTSDRPYRKAWTKEKTLEHIKKGSGTHFDPQVVKLFLQNLIN